MSPRLSNHTNESKDVTRIKSKVHYSEWEEAKRQNMMENEVLSWAESSVVELLPSIFKALGSILEASQKNFSVPCSRKDLKCKM